MFHSEMSAQEIRDALLYAKEEKNILFLGICGMGMSALARMLLREGYRVVGYDAADSGEYARLISDGIAVFHTVESIDLSCVALTVYSLAIPEEHPLLNARAPRCSRAQLLGALMLSYPVRIAVAGAHGKSTVTSLLHRTLLALGESPTTLSGADLGDGSGPLHIGQGRIFLYECCEYKNSFLYTYPTHALLLNIDLDHTDFFRSEKELSEAFLAFGARCERVNYFASDEGLARIAHRLPEHAIPYHFFDTPPAKIDTGVCFGVKESQNQDKITYSLYQNGSKRLTLTPRIGGRVGVYNTLAALCLLSSLGYDTERCAHILAALSPIARRMEHIGMLAHRPIYYDFAHHPTEIFATLTALTERHGGAVTAIFAPHTYSRTRDLWDGFVAALSLASEVYLCDIYPAREAPISGITSERLARTIGESARPISKLLIRPETLLSGDGPIVLMGAGDLREIKGAIEALDGFVPTV